MRFRTRLLATALLVAASAACSRGASETDAALNADLTRDLDLASGVGVDLAPQAAGTQVVSAIERVPEARRTPASAPEPAAAPRRKPAPAPVRVAREEPEPEVEVEAPAPAPSPVLAEPVPEAPRDVPMPRPAPSRQREPRGGWRTPSDVIRNAPFPINP